MFKKNVIKMFVNKFESLIDLLTDACGYYMDFSYSITKPVWIKQVEQFSSFYSKIKDDDEAISKFRTKVVLPFFEENQHNIVKNVANDKGVIQDKFLMITDSNSDEITINNIPKGLFFHIAKVYLPVSEVYTEVKKLIRKRKDNVPHLENILMSLYKISLCLTTEQEHIKILEENINMLADSLEVRDEPASSKKKSNNPMDMIQSMLGNINFDQIGNMMKQVTSDEKSSKEFNEIFGKVSDGLSKGENPLDTMNSLLKRATVDLNSGSAGEPASEEPEGGSNETATSQD